MYSVYMHTTPSGKRYIGITSKNPRERWAHGYRTNLHFCNAIKRYGWQNITHEVLFRGLSKEEAEEKEICLIKLYDTTNPEKGYNIASGGHSNRGYHHSEETKNKIRERLKGVKHTTERRKNQSLARKKVWTRPQYRDQMSRSHIGKLMGINSPSSRRINQYDMNGALLETFDSIMDAERALGIDHRMISDCCNKKQKTCKGFKWRYAESEV